MSIAFESKDELEQLRTRLRKVGQQRMGHTDPSLTIGTYTHAISTDERRFVEELGSRLIQ